MSLPLASVGYPSQWPSPGRRGSGAAHGPFAAFGGSRGNAGRESGSNLGCTDAARGGCGRTGSKPRRGRTQCAVRWPALVGNLPPSTNPSAGLLQSKYAALMDAVQKSLDQGKCAEAHLALSSLYGNPDLPAEQAAQINTLLDKLAGTVLYSRKHYLEPAYVTQPGDTLDKLGQKYNVPWQLLAKINGLLAPDAPRRRYHDEGSAAADRHAIEGPARSVRSDRSPGSARVDAHGVHRRRRPLSPSAWAATSQKLDSNYTVREKTLNPTYYGPDGVTIKPGDAREPSWAVRGSD